MASLRGAPGSRRGLNRLFAEPQIAEDLSGELTDFIARWPWLNHEL